MRRMLGLWHQEMGVFIEPEKVRNMDKYGGFTPSDTTKNGNSMHRIIYLMVFPSIFDIFAYHSIHKMSEYI